MGAIFTTKPVAFFKADPAQPRQQFDEQPLQELGESLLKKQIVPVLAKPDGTLVDGHRRWLGAKLVGLPTLEAIITDEPLTAAQVKEIQLVSALHRADLTPYEQYLGCKDWLALNPAATVKELAVRLDRDPSMLTRLLSLSRGIAEVQQAAAEGKLGPSDWYAISKCGTETEQAALLAARLGGASRDDLERMQRKRKQAAAAAVKVDRLKIPLADGAAVTVTGKDLSLDGVIELLQELVKAAKKGRDESLDARTWMQVMKDKAKRGGV